MASAGRPLDGELITRGPIPDGRGPRQENSSRQVAVVPHCPWVLRGRWHMKTQAKDAVALAMDWLAQLREEDGAEPPGDGQPATDSAPPTGDFGNVPPAAPPAADFTEPAPPVFTDPAPTAPPSADHRDVPAAVSPAADWGDAV